MFSSISRWALTVVLVGGFWPGVVQGQEVPTTYAWVSCMQSATADYEAVETEIWQPMHQEAVNRGLKVGWTFYGVALGDTSDCDYYTVNQFSGEDQLNAQVDFEALFAEVHPGKSWDEAWQRTYDSRRILRSELWVWVDGVAGPQAPRIQVNLMHAEDGEAYTAVEAEVWKPVHQVLTDDGDEAGWNVWSLWSPGGTEVPYNYATVDGLTRLGPMPIDEAFAEAHPDVDADAAMGQTDELRSVVRSETWWLVASTSQQ